MLGFLKLILEGMADDPQEQEEFIKEAYGSAIHLLHILNDILDIAKIEAGKMELELGRVKLDELLNHVESFTKPQAEQKNLSFLIQKPDTTDEIVVYGNYKRLLQVMLNLVSNALKFTEAGTITVTARCREGEVVISVADTGIGIPTDQVERVFDDAGSGGTAIYGPDGKAMAEAAGKEEQLVSASIPIA